MIWEEKPVLRASLLGSLWEMQEKPGDWYRCIRPEELGHEGIWEAESRLSNQPADPK